MSNMTAKSFSFDGIDHIQLAAPPGCEEAARHFYTGILGWTELTKPTELQKRGGVWFQCGAHQVHIGVQQDFVPALKAHPAFLVRQLDALRSHIAAAGINVLDDDARSAQSIRRFYVNDPWGNRLEFMEYV
ncbi:glyoxalase/bleomycin resistance protein/dioxygenase superfamily protein [Paenibacillus taihuensis]|uniref:Glyoxalase/bleomycin resistance protein/dioxygenase superfamily protein n=1 Tax=Paenibacillus taihuensis TaxID=1156355 RepID=A0A3D9RRT1_9BACL|nr:VOC family protein [Paenibacillus taihuensis]REE78771.1 glyoxalase/bleomycin resistance protein/dioxygenase superfamily protein [Paenibacillus taihuensis]